MRRFHIWLITGSRVTVQADNARATDTLLILEVGRRTVDTFPLTNVLRYREATR